jgi:NADPH-dependent glutamate synthase beta subunit-like oxidoreductase
MLDGFGTMNRAELRARAHGCGRLRHGHRRRSVCGGIPDRQEPNPFPRFADASAPHRARPRCRRGTVDAPVAIRALKRFVSERYGVRASPVLQSGTAVTGRSRRWASRSVGIVGGGPGGLAAAHDLRMVGHRSPLYESEQRLGGIW